MLISRNQTYMLILLKKQLKKYTYYLAWETNLFKASSQKTGTFLVDRFTQSTCKIDFDCTILDSSVLTVHSSKKLPFPEYYAVFALVELDIVY